MKGPGFVSDLVAVLEMMKPLVDVMLQMESLDCVTVKVKKIYPVLVENFKVLCYLQFLKNTKYVQIVINHF